MRTNPTLASNLLIAQLANEQLIHEVLTRQKELRELRQRQAAAAATVEELHRQVNEVSEAAAEEAEVHAEAHELAIAVGGLSGE